MKINDYDLDIVVQGFPGKSVCHGGLGWSSVVLMRAHGRIVLVDTGSFSMRTMLIKRFAERGLKPADITDLLLTHSHHDHSVNWTMFPKARIVIGADELAWSLKEPWGETPVPELYMRELKTWPTLHKAAEGEEVFPGITAHLAPGHTPGCLVFVLHAGRTRRDLCRRRRQKPRRNGVAHHRHDVRRRHQQGVDRNDLGAVAETARQYPCARPRRADGAGKRQDRNISTSAKPPSPPGTATTWKPRRCSI